MKSLLPLSILVASLVHVFGCTSGDSVDANIQAQRDRYMLSEEPEGAIGVLEARESDTELKEVVLFGRVKERVDGQAAFWINDPTAEIEHGHDHDGHDHSNCAFCKAQKEKSVNSTAVVQLVDDQNEPLTIDSKELLGVEKGQMVVIKGEADLDKTLDVLTVNVSGSGVYIRQ